MRNFSKAKRVVIKIGTNTLTKDSGIDADYVGKVAEQVDTLLKMGKQVVIITSGAIGMGAGQLKLTDRVKDKKLRQACAAIGQPLLMAEYRKAFEEFGVTVAQVLLTAEVLNNRKTYLNLQATIETLLKLGVVPVLNENDSISTDEIGGASSTGSTALTTGPLRTSFGDNDRLSAL